MRRLDFSVSGLGDDDLELRRRERRGTTYTLIAVLASLVVLGRGHVEVTSAVTPAVVPRPPTVADSKSGVPDSKPDATHDTLKASVPPVLPVVVLRIAVSVLARASNASDGRETSTSFGASGATVRPSTARTASTSLGVVRTYNRVGERSVSYSVAATP